MSLIVNLTPTNQPYQVLLQQVEQALVGTGHSLAQAMQMAPGQVFTDAAVAGRRAGLHRRVLLTACMSFVMIPTALLMSGVKPQGGGGMH